MDQPRDRRDARRDGLTFGSVSRARALDTALAAGVLIVGEFSILSGHTSEGPRGLTAVVALVVCACLLFRREYAVEAAIVAMAAWLVQAIAGESPNALWEIVPLVVFPYSIAAFEDRRRAVIGAVIWLAGLWTVVLLDPTAHTASDRVFTPLVFTFAPWAAGLAARRFASQADRLSELNTELERRREHDVLTATQEERARIARELHDVVAHSLSVMVVQAGAAEEVLAVDPERAAEPLRAIRSTGKNALGEMRRLLGVLRIDDKPSFEPQPGLGNLPELVAQMRSVGLDVELETSATLPALAPGPDLIAYRIVQEALTNTLKHAGTVPARVALSADDRVLVLDIADEGDRAAANGDPGHGLIGMRERVALYGGSVSAGPRSDAPYGWRVHAELPLEPDT